MPAWPGSGSGSKNAEAKGSFCRLGDWLGDQTEAKDKEMIGAMAGRTENATLTASDYYSPDNTHHRRAWSKNPVTPVFRQAKWLQAKISAQ